MATPRLTWLSSILVPFCLSAAAALSCLLIVGPTLGLFFGGVLFATLLLPPLVMAETSHTRQALAGGMTVLAIVLIWLVAVFEGAVTMPQWLACAATLAAYALALWGTAALLRAIGVHPALASAAVVVLALAWLSWPVWLSPWHGESIVNRLVPAHPLFAINGVLIRRFGPWGEAPLAYSTLMNLQDVAYVMPEGVVPCILLHGAAGVSLGGAGWLLGAAKRRKIVARGASPVVDNGRN